MAAKELSGLSGSTQILFYSFFLLLFSMIALAFNETFTGSRTKKRQSSNNNPKDEGNVCALLLCCWLLLLPLGQHINVNKQNQFKQIGLSQDINDQAVNINEIPRIYFFGHGYLAIYSITKQSDHLRRGTPSKQNNRRRGNRHDFNVFLILILLSGDVQLNPGPTTHLPPANVTTNGLHEWQLRPGGTDIFAEATGTPYGVNGMIQSARKQREFRFFQTVNHARVIWEPTSKPKGILGGHLNIQSILPTRIEHLLTDSNLDFLALSETWLHSNIPTSMIDVSGYTCYRQDRTSDKGWGGVLFDVRDTLKCNEIELNTPFH